MSEYLGSSDSPEAGDGGEPDGGQAGSAWLEMGGAETPAANGRQSAGWAETADAAEERRACARAQIHEMEKYRWYLGERLGHDPLLDRTRNEICAEWIARYAAEFRAWWDSRRPPDGG
jgi:hypothetical protein